jgi:Uncharacterized conserved protein
LDGSILGLDIEPNYSGNYRTFSIALIKDDEVKIKKTNVNLREIIFLIKKFNVELIATDNIFELASNERELRKLFIYFPSRTRIIQITGNPASPSSTLVEVARKYGFQVPSKLQPLETAVLVAKLASLGVGYPIKLQEDETFIIVSKAMEPSAGGMSMDRYKRNVYANIQYTVNYIRNLLNVNGLKYDLFFSKRSKEGCVFLVYSNKEEVKKFVKPYKGYGIKVRIIPVVKTSNIFSSISNITARPLIVAVDPGLSVGLAILGLDGSLVSLESLKYAGINSIIEYIIQKGKPLIITSDKCRASNMVNKLATKFGSALILPDKDLGVEEKKKLVENYTNLFEIGNRKINSHMRDALAAAYFTFKKIYPTLVKIESELKDFLLSKEDMNKIFEKIIKEKRTLREAFEETIKDESYEELKVPSVKIQKQELNDKSLEILKRRVDELERITNFQSLKLQEKDSIIAKLKQEVEKLKDENYLNIKKNVEVSLLKRRIEDLLNENKRLEEEIIEGKLIIRKLIDKIKELKKREQDVFIIIDNLENIENEKIIGEVVVTKNINKISNKILTLLASSKVKLIVTLKEVPKEIVYFLNNHGIVVLKIDELDHYIIENIVFLNPKQIKEKLSTYQQLIREKEEDEKERIIKFLKDLKEIKT